MINGFSKVILRMGNRLSSCGIKIVRNARHIFVFCNVTTV